MKPFFPLFALLLVLSLAACTPAAVEAPAAPAVVEEAAPAEEVELAEPASPAAEEAPEVEPIVLKDGLDRIITLEAPAQAIISLAPSNTELLYGVGAGDQIIAREDYSNFPEAALELPSIGNTQEQNLEIIVSLEPDLVLAADINAPEQIAAIEDLGITVFQLGNPTDLDGLYENMRTVAELTGHEEETETWIETAKARVATVEETIAQAETTPTVFYELDATNPTSPWTSGAGTFIDTLITMAGGENIAGGMEAAWAQFSQEELIIQDPQIILLGDAMWGISPEMVAERPGWEELTAVVNAQVLPFNDDLVSRPGPRLIDGLEALAQAIHPELFAE
jgi:cobalamin transport system substrate-binding protein